MRQAGRVLGKPCKLGVRTGAGKDAGITFGERAPALALERAGDDYRPAACGAGVDDPVDEVDKLIRETNSDLLAHPKTVAKWETRVHWPTFVEQQDGIFL
jgi:hypothetical protein